MAKHITPYQLIQSKTEKILFQANYVKYYPDTPFCAMFKEYPADKTEIWVCRRVDPEEQQYGFRLAMLLSHGAGGTNKIGDYIKVFQASSEEEADNKLLANLYGIAMMRNNLTQEEEA